MADKGTRKGGLRVDPAVQEWQEKAVTNVAALTRKQRYDRARVRVKLDVPAEVKAALEEHAGELETSGSQLAAFLLAWAMAELREGNRELAEAIERSKVWARALRFKFDLDPSEFLQIEE
jgi:hypothetical protein